MRTRWIITTVLLSLTTLAFLLRHHVLVLSDLAQTYTRFHSYISQHPDTLFRIPDLEPPTMKEEIEKGKEEEDAEEGEEEEEDISLPSPIPKIIHQISLGPSTSRLEKYQPAIESCKALHPNWEFRFWTDSEGEIFMEKHYGEIFPHYKAYKQNIQRANILRYAVLHHFGGVYLDLDVTCRVALDAPLRPGSNRRAKALTEIPFLTPGAAPAGVNNAFILSRKGHPFFAGLLENVAKHDLSWGLPYAENMLSTGCGFFGNMWMRFVLLEGNLRKKEDRVYVLADEKGGMESQMLRGKIVTPLFEHGGASSWHGWDAALFVLIGKHYMWFIAGLTAALFLVVMGTMKLGLRRQRCRGEDQEELLGMHTRMKRG